jgi:hypothetical protein
MIKEALRYINPRSIIWIITLSLITIYFGIGIFPISLFETDSIAIANNCQHIINTGVFKGSVIGHSFDMQSGTYFLIVTLSKLFHTATFVIYSIISSIAAISFIIFIVIFIKQLCGYNILLIVSLLLLFQEITALAYYPNSTSLSSAFWMLGFIILIKKPSLPRIILAGLILSLSAWFRIDILFVFPSVLPLLFIVTKDIKKSILFSTILAVIVLILLWVFMSVCNAKISGFMGYTEYHGTLFGMANNLGALDLSLLRAHLASYSLLLVILFLMGLVFILRKKEWKLLMFIISGMVFYYMLGINNTVAPKHLAPFTLFWMLAILYGLDKILKLGNKNFLILLSLVIIFVFQYFIGYKVDILSIPYANKEYSLLNPVPSYVKLFKTGQIGAKIGSVETRIGAGTKIPSSDEILLSSGIVFNPVSWRIMKEKTLKTTRDLRNYIDTCTQSELNIMVTDGSSQFVVNSLMSNHFYWQEDTVNWGKHLDFMRAPNKKVELIRKMGFVKEDINSFKQNFQSMPPGRFLAIFYWDWQKYMMNEKVSIGRKISDGLYEIEN